MSSNTDKLNAMCRIPLNRKLQTLSFDELLKARDMLQRMIDEIARQQSYEYRPLKKKPLK